MLQSRDTWPLVFAKLGKRWCIKSKGQILYEGDFVIVIKASGHKVSATVLRCVHIDGDTMYYTFKRTGKNSWTKGQKGKWDK